MRLELATVERSGRHVNITLHTDHATAERLLRELCGKPTPAETYEAFSYLQFWQGQKESYLETHGCDDDDFVFRQWNPDAPAGTTPYHQIARQILARAGVDPDGPRPFVLRLSETPSGQPVERYIPRNECVGSKSDGWESYELARRTPWSSCNRQRGRRRRAA